jgi:hypothetical protein
MPKACREFVPVGIMVQQCQFTVSLSSGFSPYEISQQRPFSLVLVTSPKISPDCSGLLIPLLVNSLLQCRLICGLMTIMTKPTLVEHLHS